MRTLSHRRSVLMSIALVTLSCLTGLMLPAATPAFASAPSGPQIAAMGVAFLFVGIIFIAAYIYMALALQTIAQKTNTENPWLAWIPIANLILMINIARKPLWWVVLFFIPLVNLVILIIIWMGIAEARNKPSWWGILLIVPVANLIVPGYLAWSD